MGIQDKDETDLDLTSTGTVAEFQPTGSTRLTTVMEDAGGSVTVKIQVRERDGTWRDFHDFGSVSSIQDSRELSAYEARVQITSTSLSGSETADFYVAAGDQD